MKLLVLAALCVLAFAAPAWAGFEEGMVAYNRGDYATAFREMKPSAEDGNANAQHNLGFMYKKGLGVPQDYDKALKWYRSAAEQDHTGAQNNIGFMYANGQGVPQNYAEALKWYRKAASQSNADAQNNLGFMYLKGRGVPQDDTEAARWYRMAADLGHGQARFTLGAITEEGRSVRQDFVQAYAWYTLAGESGIELGAVLRERVARQMKPEQIAAARALTEELRAGRLATAAPAPEKTAPVPETVAPPKPEAPPVPKSAPRLSEKVAPEKAPKSAVAALEKAHEGGTAAGHASVDGDAAYRVRLAAYRSTENLAKGWKILRRAHTDLLGKLQSSRHRVDLGADKGVFHRLEVGPLANRAAAAALCTALKARKVDCIVVAP